MWVSAPVCLPTYSAGSISAWGQWRGGREGGTAGKHTYLGHAALVPQQHTDGGGRHTLACQLADLLNDVLGGGLAPGGRAALVGKGGAGQPLALWVVEGHSMVGGGVSGKREWGKEAHQSEHAHTPCCAYVPLCSAAFYGVSFRE